MKPDAYAGLDAVVDENCDLLDQLAGLIRRVDPGCYTEPAPSLGMDPIGCHVRHLLDHHTALLQGFEAGRVDYDDRQRQTDVERSPAAALEAARRCHSDLRRLADAGTPNQSLPVRHVPRVAGLDGTALAVASTLARELTFLVSHTCHHLALIGVLARHQGIGLPEHFGVASSTLRHLAGSDDRHAAASG